MPHAGTMTRLAVTPLWATVVVGNADNVSTEGKRLHPPIRHGSMRGAEAIQHVVSPHIDQAVAERWSGVDFIAQIVHGQYLPLRRGLQHGHLALRVCQKQLV